MYENMIFTIFTQHNDSRQNTFIKAKLINGQQIVNVVNFNIATCWLALDHLLRCNDNFPIFPHNLKSFKAIDFKKLLMMKASK